MSESDVEFKRPVKKFIKGPDRKARDTKINEIKSKIKDVDYKLSKVNENISKFKADDKTIERRNKLQSERNAIIKQQAELKDKRSVINNKIKSVDASLKKKIGDLNATASKNRFKSIQEIDRQIQKLDDDISSGNLKIVEERMNVKEITALRKLRKDFGQIEVAQKQIDEDKAKIAELKKELSAVHNKELQAKFETVSNELNEIRESNNSLSQKSKSLYDQRTALNKEKDVLYSEMKTIYSEYKEAYDKFTKDLAAEKERVKKEEETMKKDLEKTKKEDELKKELEKASKPAFSEQISNIKLLVKYFSKMIGEPVPEELFKSDDSAAKRLADLSINKPASTGRVIEMPSDYVVIKKERESLVAGHKGKSKKDKKKGESKFVIEPDVIVQLSELGLLVPTSKDGIPNLISELTKQFSIFKNDQDTVTKKNVEKAKAKLEAFQKKTEEAAEVEEAEEN